MADNGSVIVYKPSGRDLAPLETACFQSNLRLVTCQDESELEKAVFGDPISIIATLTSQEHGRKEALEFADIAMQMFRPEDADVLVIYSSITGTPSGWQPGDPPDPRPTVTASGSETNSSAVLELNDIDWIGSIRRIAAHNSIPRYRATSARLVNIEPSDRIVGRDAPPFPTEAGFLLRSAFKDMSAISVSAARQGLSGAMVFTVEAFDENSVAMPKKLAKIYPDEGKALKEYNNYKNYVDRYFKTPHHVPHYDNFRRYRGRGYSIFVMDLISDSDGNIVTLLDMIRDPKFDVTTVASLITSLLAVLSGSWSGTILEDHQDLVDQYLGVLSSNDKPERVRAIESEIVCNRWFGGSYDRLSARQKIFSSFPATVLQGSNSKFCHGDLHCDNVLIDGRMRELIPIPIDFSRTGRGHFLKDLVTLECDVIIRGPDQIPALSNPTVISGWLRVVGSRSGEPIDGVSEAPHLLQMSKIAAVVGRLRADAQGTYNASLTEYRVSALLKTLDFLSYGHLTYDQTLRAVGYVNHLCHQLRN
jgi:hypothetical protein